MIAKLVKKNNDYICSECRMRQYDIQSYCSFCKLPFSNYEEVMFDLVTVQEDFENEKDI